MFARRAQRMLNMSFLDIMRELSPDSMSHLEMLTGANAQQQDLVIELLSFRSSL